VPQTGDVGLSPGASIPRDAFEKALAPLLEKWGKDFAEVLASIVQKNPDGASSSSQPSSVGVETGPLPQSQSSPLNLTQDAALPAPPYGDRPWWDVHAYEVEIPTHGFHVGQMAPGTNIPNWIGLDNPSQPIDPSRIPQWDGAVPPRVPAGSMPFYASNGSLEWLGLDGQVRTASGDLVDTVFIQSVASLHDMSPSLALLAVRGAVEAAGRPLTIGEVRQLRASYVGEPQNPYPLFFETEGARREQAALALRNSPYGFGPGKIAPGTTLPAWVSRGTSTEELGPDDMPQWDGQVPPGLAASSVPFYAANGYLQWLAPNGMIYSPNGELSDSTAVHLMADRNNLSVPDFVAAIRAAVSAAGRALTLGEMYAGGASMNGAPLLARQV
jgi:hypothetical protein